VAGAIALLLGAVGLMQVFGSAILPFDLGIVSAYLTTEGAILLFGAIAVVGLLLMIGGLVTLGERENPTVVQPAVVQQPALVAAQATTYPVLSSLELSILRFVSQGVKPGEIASKTGVSESLVREKIVKLRAEGYMTENNTLTEKGFEVLRASEERLVYMRQP
jgi:hypothetical protein